MSFPDSACPTCPFAGKATLCHARRTRHAPLCEPKYREFVLRRTAEDAGLPPPAPRPRPRAVVASARPAPGVQHTTQSDRDALYRRFGRRERITLPAGCGVLTAADSGAFTALQLMAASLLLSHDAPLAVFDLGLSAPERSWCLRQPIELLDPPDRVMPRTENMWQSWDRPEYLAASPFDKTLWLDCDTLVAGDLNPLFAAIDEGPGPLLLPDIFVRDPGWITNKPGLYERWPTPTRIARFNAGVMGLQRDRPADEAFLGLARNMLRSAADDPTLRALISWWDQGIFLHAAESLGLVIRDESDWDRPGRDEGEMGRRAASVADLIGGMPDGLVIHYMGAGKPWCDWPRGVLDLDLTTPEDLRVFVIGHSEEGLRETAERPFLEPVNLTDLDPDQAWAESRFWGHLPDLDSLPEYVGFFTWRYRLKHAGRDHLYPIEEFHRLAPRLGPKRVICAAIAPKEWARGMDDFTPGLMPYIDELRAVSGLTESGPSLWSQNFLSHRDVLKDFLAFHRRMSDHFQSRYGARCEGMTVDLSAASPDPGHGRCTAPGERTAAAYIGEAIACHWFASRPDLEIVEAWPDLGPYVPKCSHRKPAKVGTCRCNFVCDLGRGINGKVDTAICAACDVPV
jgi:hypothetical protein